MFRRTTMPAILVAVLGATGAANAVPSAGKALGPVEVITGATPVPAPLPEALAAALGAANQLAAAHPDDLSHAWADRRTGSLVLAATTSRGGGLAAGLGGRLDPAVRSGTVRVARSYAALEHVKHQAIDLTGTDVPGAGAILATWVDAERNQVVVEANAAPTGLLAELAARYGDAVVLKLSPGKARLSPQSRNNDMSPFWGGANINVPAGGCTSGFPWHRNGAQRMLSAGHCASTGGAVSTPVVAMGNVTSASGENWDSATGTTYLTGQSTYRGDLSRIDITSPSTAGGQIYVGGVNSSTNKIIDSMFSRRAQVGDAYCTGGAYSGEICGWSVTQVGANLSYGPGVTGRNMVAGTKSAPCTVNGDSGGPIYTATATTVAAKGIHSGGSVSGTTCTQSFTDIWNAWDAFGGFVGMPLTSLGDRRTSGQQVQQNQQIKSPNGIYVARMQADGNFVILKNSTAIWSTRTYSSANEGTYGEMQSDGNFVLYRPGYVAVWSTGTSGNIGAHIRMQDDCNLVLYRSNGTAAWASNTAGC